MHKHDEARIAALAEGRLPADEATAFEAEVAGCLTCTELLADHRLAIEALASLPEPHLTELERARLHRQVRPSPGPARKPRWARLAPALAAAAALVAVVGVVSMLQGGTETSFEAARSPLQSADTAAATSTTGVPATTAAPTMGAVPAAPEADTDRAPIALTFEGLPGFIDDLRAQNQHPDPASIPCPSLVEGRELVAAEAVLLDDRSVEVLVFDDEALVVDPSSCEVVTSVSP